MSDDPIAQTMTFITAQRAALLTKRETIFTKQAELQKQLDELNAMLSKFDVFEGKAPIPRASSTRAPRARAGSRRDAVLRVVKDGDGLTRGEILENLGLKGNKTGAMSVSNALTAVLVLVAAVTLAVGGVGIMNIMLATVRARIREIGIRKALGATYREIKLQFLAEAVIISLTGGVVGTILGLALPLSVRLFTDYPLPISFLSIVIALAAAVGVGVVFGTVPATRAAQMDPVESLKYE